VPRIRHFCSCVYVFGCRLSLVRLCDSDFGITPVDDITIRITCVAFCFHIAYISFASSWYLLCLSFIVFGEIMCIWNSCVYQKGVLCFLIHKSYIRSIKNYCFFPKACCDFRQLEIFIIQYISWCVLIIIIIVIIKPLIIANNVFDLLIKTCLI